MEVSTCGGDSPCLAFGASASVDAGRLLLWHGGTNREGGSPTGTLRIFDTTHEKWYTVEKGPIRSHHGGFVSDDRYFHVVGGWDGQKRTHDISTFDSRGGEWIKHRRPASFPEGGGLSSHSVNGLESIGETAGAVVIGRLGGLRTQRCHSALLRIQGDLRTGFVYSGPIEKGIESRGGHSAVGIGVRTMQLLGGRADTFVGLQTEEVQLPDNFPALQRVFWKRSSIELKKEEQPMTSLSGRRYQASVTLSDQTVLVHGGEPFGRMMIGQNTISSELWIVDRRGKRWKSRESQLPPLYGHSMIPIDRSHRLAIVGGLTSTGKPNRDLIIIS
ncbi:hypothetical protein PFISCL1PPCAC_27199 [Pristionchus fissidentatus]|uniref:Uncharacterized protein n=1 Tax=Pristionchus fissidentatus TaxID=1538716 RepID=A0AAV5WV20_9BILA|nr:hypothetical protein PFISCL1PPCAC_27199 [Pristionchus fissidentatus]